MICPASGWRGGIPMQDFDAPPRLIISKLLMAMPLFALFLYTLPYFAATVNPAIVVMLLAAPFLSHLFSERRRPAFYFMLEMVFLAVVIGLVFGSGSSQARAVSVYSVIITAEFALPFAFSVEMMRSKTPSAALLPLILGLAILLNEVAVIAYSQLKGLSILNSYIDVWSLQLQGILRLLESGYQNTLPLQTMNPGVSPVIVALLIASVLGFFMFVYYSGGDRKSVRVEQMATQVFVGTAITIVVIGAALLLSATGLSIAVISIGTIAVFVPIVRIARRSALGD